MTQPMVRTPSRIAPAPAHRDALHVAELEARLREAEETLDAIRNGEVDAVVVGGPSGQQVYTLENADRPYRVLIEQMQEGAVTLSADGIVLYCNQRFATIVGTPREAIIGGLVGGYFADGENFLRLLARRQAAGASGEFMLAAADGGNVPVNVSLVDLEPDEGMPRIVCGVVTDLSHSRQRNHELAAANARLASEIEERRLAEDSLQIALDAAGMGSWQLDLATGMAQRSPRYDQIFGFQQAPPTWSLEAALVQFLPEDRDAVAEAFALAETTGSIEFEKRIRRSGDAAIRWIHVKGRTYYEEGVAVRLAGVVADVTDRRQVEEELRQAQKMEAVGQLTGGMAHDFNNLLMIIGGSLEMLGRRVALDEKASQLLDAARQGVARGAKLNQQLLAFSRRQDLRVEALCVDDLIPTFQELIDRAIGETIAIRVEPAPQTWFCRTDPHQLETAILNLAINARDAMPQGGTVTLSTENRDVDEPTAAAWAAKPGEYVVVSVADSGTGMTPGVLARAFEPFFTTKEIGKGTGLGLSQVYGFARQSGGFAMIESAPGLGTKVRIHLPRTAPPEAVARMARPSAMEIKGDGVILVVEDDAGVRATTSSMLRDLGYQVREARTGPLALALVDRGEPVDLVFSDVIMPDGMSGIELARELAARHPGLPVLLTSGYTAHRLVPEAMADHLPVLRKPYAQSDLSYAIRDAMNGTRPARRRTR